MCEVEPGQPHEDGCGVARCVECGQQRITCKHEDSDLGWGSIWTGEWPGLAEVREYGLESLNDLYVQPLLSWSKDQERWVLPSAPANLNGI